ncbi:MAG: baseplate J/gp47 family protein [Gammaproteobacteria bacterium]|nr:baseplate J/gp47 family protein [Gammaproteobacteria bacterium]
MPLPTPKLDDRRFDDLVLEARRRISQHCPQWTDLSVGDPGMMLVDIFAYLTDIMLFRLNQVPDKNYVRYLQLIGVQIQPPVAASVALTFKSSRALEKAVEIKRGTRVTSAHSGGGAIPPIFITAENAILPAGQTEKTLTAYHCTSIEHELAGRGNGLPGLSVTVRHAPIVASTTDSLSLVVAVECIQEELDVTSAALQYQGKTYRVWREVEDFSNIGEERHVYSADRTNGIISFAPALRLLDPSGGLEDTTHTLAEIPKDGAEILVSYYSGGGAEGNVAAKTLTIIKDPLPGFEVTNLSPATGGRCVESLDNALLRGPIELHSLRRVVTARDFELVATRSSGAVEQARAFTKAGLWRHASPGTVLVLLVPQVPREMRGEFGQVSAEVIQKHQTDTAREQIQQTIDARKPLGTSTEVAWTRLKQLQIKAKVVVHREEDATAVKQRLLQRLYQTISPLATPPAIKAWSFGRPVTGWDVYKIMSYEPSVISVAQVRLTVESSPDKDVGALAADNYQPQTWYAGMGATCFRSMNNAMGWEIIARFATETIDLIKPYPPEKGSVSEHAGLVAVASRLEGDNAGSRLHFSRDCGESWELGPQTKFHVQDMAWIERDGVANLLLATELGLYQVEAKPGAVPRQIVVDTANQTLGFVAVIVSTGAWGGTSVAVAAREERGVFLSSEGGRPNTFKPIGLEGEVIPVLAVQRRDLDQYLWAGVAAPGEQPGSGCYRWRLTGSVENNEGWRPYNKAWKGGSCRALAFQQSRVFAATSRLGVLRLDVDAQDPAWQVPDVSCGLPLHEVGRLEIVDSVVNDPDGTLVMAAGIKGIYRSQDNGINYNKCSLREFTDEVSLPRTWLFCSGDHEIEVVSEDEI